MIELRSDVFTQPSPAMRWAMADAVVGDEQEREDPTVSELERRGAELLGHEEAVFVPTATMANQIALRVLSRPGDELLAHENAHVLISEQGGAAVFSGLMTRGLPRTGTDGSGPRPDPRRRSASTTACRSRARRASCPSRTRTTAPADGSGRSPSWRRSPRPAASSISPCTWTARG